MKSWRYLLIALPLAFLSPLTAKAADIIIDDTSPDDTITITVNDFENGFSVNGNLIQVGLRDPQSIILSEANPLSFSGEWRNMGQSTTVTNRTVYFVEPDDPTLINKIFTYSVFTNGFFGTIDGTFVSSSSGNLGTLPSGIDPSNIVIENFNNPFLFSSANLTGTIRFSAIPEPLTILGVTTAYLFGAYFKRKLSKKP